MPTSGKDPTKGKAGACGMKDFGKPARLVLTLLFVVGNVNDGSFGGRKRFGLLSRDDDRAVLRLGFRNVGSLVEKALRVCILNDPVHSVGASTSPLISRILYEKAVHLSLRFWSCLDPTSWPVFGG